MTCLSAGKTASFCISYVVRAEDGKLYWDRTNEIKMAYSDGEIEENVGNEFFLLSPEYSYIPLISKTYPVGWTDWNFNVPLVLSNLKKFKVIFIDGGGYEFLKGYKLPCKIYPVPIFSVFAKCSNKSKEYSSLKNKKSIDVLFLGNLNPAVHLERNRILKKVLLLPPEIKVVVGSGLYDEDLYCRVLECSKIIFNKSIRNEMNMRVFEAVRNYSLLFLEEENIDTPIYLEKWKDYIPYTEDNLQELIIRYIKDEEVREKIVLSANGKSSNFEQDSFWRKINSIVKDCESVNIDRGDPRLLCATFSSLVENLFNFPAFSEVHIDYAESRGLSILESIDGFDDFKIFKSCVLCDLAFLSTFSLRHAKSDEKKKNLINKAERYISSAISFLPNSGILWFNYVVMLYNLGERRIFYDAANRFFEVMKNEGVRGITISTLPDVFSYTLFLHNTYFRSYIDHVWIRYLSDIDRLRREIFNTLLTQVFVLLSGYALDRGDLDEAEKFISYAISNFPKFSDLYFMMGRVKFEKKEYSDSANYYLKGYELNPLDFKRWVEIIAALSYAGKRDLLQSFLEEINLMARRIFYFNGLEINIGDKKIKINPVSKILEML